MNDKNTLLEQKNAALTAYQEAFQEWRKNPCYETASACDKASAVYRSAKNAEWVSRAYPHKLNQKKGTTE